MPFWGTNRFKGCKYWSPLASLTLVQQRKRYLTRSKPFITTVESYMPLASLGQPAESPSRLVEIATRPSRTSAPEIRSRTYGRSLELNDPLTFQKGNESNSGIMSSGHIMPSRRWKSINNVNI